MCTITRRSFLSGVLASPLSRLYAKGKAAIDQTLIALVSDTHICGNETSTYQRTAYQRIVTHILSLNPLPGFVVNAGDYAFLFGKKCDYETARHLTAPLEAAGIKVVIGMGNHDRRASFLEFNPQYAETTQVPNRIVSVLETPYVNFIMLDSCLEGPVGGAIDDDQADWLKTALTASRKPVIIGSHHDPFELRMAPILQDCPAVAGYIYGHHHTWANRQIQLNGKKKRLLQAVCLPSTGHWGDIGFALMHTTADRAVVALHQHDYYTPRPLAKEKRPAAWDERVKKNQGKMVCFELRCKV